MLKIRYFIAVFLLIAPCAVFATLYEPIEDEITANIKALYSEDQETRDTAYERLIEIGAPAVPKLIETLGVGADFLIDDTHTVENRYGSTGMRTENVPISFIAARALAGIGADAVPALIEALEQGGIDTHKWSAYALGRIKPPPSDATQPLIDALEDPNTDVRQYARGALKRMDVETIPILIYDIWAGYPFESNQAEIKLRSMYDQSEEIVPILMVLLTKADENQAESIIRVLTGHWEKSLSPMLDALETDDEQLRNLLIEAITKKTYVPDGMMSRIGGLLNNESKTLKAWAISMLKQYREAAAEYIPALMESLLDESPDVRAEAVLTLLFVTDDQDLTVTNLVGLLDDESADVLKNVLTVLGKQGLHAEELLPVIIPFVQHEDPSVRSAACKALAVLGSDDIAAITALIKALEDDSSNTRRAAANSLWMLGEKAVEAVPALIETLEDDDDFVVVEAIRALGKMKQAAVPAIPALIGLLKDENRYVAENTIYALMKIGPAAEDALPMLKQIVETRPELSSVAIRAIGLIGSRSEVGFLTDLLEQEDSPFIEAASALGYIGNEPGVLPTLLDALETGSKPLKIKAINGLGELGPAAKDTVPVILEYINDEDEELRRCVYNALRKIGPDAKQAIPYLLKALETEGPGPIQSVIGALGGIGRGLGVVPALIRALKDNNSIIRSSAAWSLGNLGPDAEMAIPALVEALDDDGPYVRNHAAHALGMMGPMAIDAIPKLRELSENDTDIHPSRRIYWIRETALEAINLIESTKSDESIEPDESTDNTRAESQ